MVDAQDLVWCLDLFCCLSALTPLVTPSSFTALSVLHVLRPLKFMSMARTSSATTTLTKPLTSLSSPNYPSKLLVGLFQTILNVTGRTVLEKQMPPCSEPSSDSHRFPNKCLWRGLPTNYTRHVMCPPPPLHPDLAPFPLTRSTPNHRPACGAQNAEHGPDSGTPSVWDTFPPGICLASSLFQVLPKKSPSRKILSGNISSQQLRAQIPQSAHLGSNPDFASSWGCEFELINLSGLQFPHL